MILVNGNAKVGGEEGAPDGLLKDGAYVNPSGVGAREGCTDGNEIEGE